MRLLILRHCGKSPIETGYRCQFESVLMTSLIVQARTELSAFDHKADLRYLRIAAARLIMVNLLAPADPGERLELRRQTLVLWLALMSRLDEYIMGLRLRVAGDERTDSERNRLSWQCELIDREASGQAAQFIQRYYTRSPVDVEELRVAMVASDVSTTRQSLLFD